MNSDDPQGFGDLSALMSRSIVDTGPDLDPAAVRKARHRRLRQRIIGGSIALLIIAAIATYIPLTLTAPLPEATVSVTTPEIAPGPAVALALPGVGSSALSVSGIEGYQGLGSAGGILASSGSADPLPIASITKLITAMVILEAKPLAPTEAGPTITFSKADADLYDAYYVQQATVQSMRTGSSVSQHDALELMLVASASNYADAVSTWAFGSRADFLAATRTWLADHALASTTIVDPTGISPRNTSTIADLLALGTLAAADATIAAIVASPSLDVPGFGSVGNTNDLVGSFGITGIKTGTLESAGSCLLFSATLDVGADTPLTVIGVVLGGASRASVDASVTTLLDSLKAGFHEIPTVTAGQVVGRYTTVWGESADIVAPSDEAIFTFSDAPVSALVQTEPLTTGLAGDEVGQLGFAGETRTSGVALELGGDIRGPDELWRLTHPFELLGR